MPADRSYRIPRLIDRRSFLRIGAAISVPALLGDAFAADASLSDDGIRLEGIEELYESVYSTRESGFRRLDSGHLLVSAHHRMIGCQGMMIDWWLNRTLTQEEFQRWHPIDHIAMDTIEDAGPKGRVGKRTRVKQTVGGQLRDTILEARDPAEYFDDVNRLRASGVTAVICSRGRLASLPVWSNRIIHVCRDHDWGCEMRSRFWLGPMAPLDDVPPPAILQAQFPDGVASGLLKHTLEEYTYLARFLPDYYRSRASSRQG
jgi:hypothetical protein